MRRRREEEQSCAPTGSACWLLRKLYHWNEDDLIASYLESCASQQVRSLYVFDWLEVSSSSSSSSPPEERNKVSFLQWGLREESKFQLNQHSWETGMNTNTNQASLLLGSRFQPKVDSLNIKVRCLLIANSLRSHFKRLRGVPKAVKIHIYYIEHVKKDMSSIFQGESP